jgi:hypothetical protein
MAMLMTICIQDNHRIRKGIYHNDQLSLTQLSFNCLLFLFNFTPLFRRILDLA